MKRHGPNGKIRDDAEVSQSVILNYSTAQQNCLITGGFFTDCTLGGDMKVAGHPTAVSSHLACDFIGGDPTILSSSCFGSVRIYDNASLEDVILNGPIAVFGDAVIKNWHLSVESPDLLRIHAGIWLKPPRFIQVGRYLVSDCANGKTHVGCYCKLNTWWLAHYRLGTRLGVDPEAIKQFILGAS